MPTENERKYVLDIKSEEEIEDLKATKAVIEQGYTAFSKGLSLRIRKKQTSLCKRPTYYLTYKQKVTSRTIEIENEIEERDFKELWDICVGKLKKIRYTFADNIGNFWEVDFFKKNGETYFVLAEVELPEGVLAPKNMPKYINKFLLYEVPLTDCRFSNKRLGDVEYALELHNTIKKGVKNEGL